MGIPPNANSNFNDDPWSFLETQFSMHSQEPEVPPPPHKDFNDIEELLKFITESAPSDGSDFGMEDVRFVPMDESAQTMPMETSSTNDTTSQFSTPISISPLNPSASSSLQQSIGTSTQPIMIDVAFPRGLINELTAQHDDLLNLFNSCHTVGFRENVLDSCVKKAIAFLENVRQAHDSHDVDFPIKMNLLAYISSCIKKNPLLEREYNLYQTRKASSPSMHMPNATSSQSSTFIVQANPAVSPTKLEYLLQLKQRVEVAYKYFAHSGDISRYEKELKVFLNELILNELGNYQPFQLDENFKNFVWFDRLSPVIQKEFRLYTTLVNARECIGERYATYDEKRFYIPFGGNAEKPDSYKDIGLGKTITKCDFYLRTPLDRSKHPQFLPYFQLEAIRYIQTPSKDMYLDVLAEKVNVPDCQRCGKDYIYFENFKDNLLSLRRGAVTPRFSAPSVSTTSSSTTQLSAPIVQATTDIENLGKIIQEFTGVFSSSNVREGEKIEVAKHFLFKLNTMSLERGVLINLPKDVLERLKGYEEYDAQLKDETEFFLNICECYRQESKGGFNCVSLNEGTKFLCYGEIGLEHGMKNYKSEEWGKRFAWFEFEKSYDFKKINPYLLSACLLFNKPANAFHYLGILKRNEKNIPQCHLNTLTTKNVYYRSFKNWLDYVEKGLKDSPSVTPTLTTTPTTLTSVAAAPRTPEDAEIDEAIQQLLKVRENSNARKEEKVFAGKSFMFDVNRISLTKNPPPHVEEYVSKILTEWGPYNPDLKNEAQFFLNILKCWQETETKDDFSFVKLGLGRKFLCFGRGLSEDFIKNYLTIVWNKPFIWFDYNIDFQKKLPHSSYYPYLAAACLLSNKLANAERYLAMLREKVRDTPDCLVKAKANAQSDSVSEGCLTLEKWLDKVQTQLNAPSTTSQSTSSTSTTQPPVPNAQPTINDDDAYVEKIMQECNKVAVDIKASQSEIINAAKTFLVKLNTHTVGRKSPPNVHPTVEVYLKEFGEHDAELKNEAEFFLNMRECHQKLTIGGTFHYANLKDDKLLFIGEMGCRIDKPQNWHTLLARFEIPKEFPRLNYYPYLVAACLLANKSTHTYDYLEVLRRNEKNILDCTAATKSENTSNNFCRTFKSWLDQIEKDLNASPLAIPAIATTPQNLTPVAVTTAPQPNEGEWKAVETYFFRAVAENYLAQPIINDLYVRQLALGDYSIPIEEKTYVKFCYETLTRAPQAIKMFLPTLLFSFYFQDEKEAENVAIRAIYEEFVEKCKGSKTLDFSILKQGQTLRKLHRLKNHSGIQANEAAQTLVGFHQLFLSHLVTRGKQIECPLFLVTHDGDTVHLDLMDLTVGTNIKHKSATPKTIAFLEEHCPGAKVTSSLDAPANRVQAIVTTEGLEKFKEYVVELTKKDPSKTPCLILERVAQRLYTPNKNSDANGKQPASPIPPSSPAGSSSSESSSSGSSPDNMVIDRATPPPSRKGKEPDNEPEIKRRREVTEKETRKGATRRRKIAESGRYKELSSKPVGPSQSSNSTGGDLLEVTSSVNLSAPELSLKDLNADNFWTMINSVAVDAVVQKAKLEDYKRRTLLNLEKFDYKIVDKIKEVKISDPANLPLLNPMLKRYQIEEVSTLLDYFKVNASRMLAAEMGLGKTIMFFELLMQMVMQGKIHGPMIVTGPKSVVIQSVGELQRFLRESLLMVYRIFLAKDLDDGAGRILTYFGIRNKDDYNPETSGYDPLLASWLYQELPEHYKRLVPKNYPHVERNAAKRSATPMRSLDLYTKKDLKRILTLSPNKIVGGQNAEGLSKAWEKNPAIVVTTVNALDQQKLPAQIGAFVCDEAQNDKKEGNQGYDKLAGIFKAHPNAPVTLVTGTPFENHISETWSLLALANNRENVQFDPNTLVSLDKAYNKTIESLSDLTHGKKEAKPEELKQFLQNSFAHFHALKKQIIEPLITRIRQSDPRIKEDWNNAFPIRVDHPMVGITQPLAAEQLETVFQRHKLTKGEQIKWRDRKIIQLNVEKAALQQFLQPIADQPLEILDPIQQKAIGSVLKQLADPAQQEALVQASPLMKVTFGAKKIQDFVESVGLPQALLKVQEAHGTLSGIYYKLGTTHKIKQLQYNKAVVKSLLHHSLEGIPLSIKKDGAMDPKLKQLLDTLRGNDKAKRKAIINQSPLLKTILKSAKVAEIFEKEQTALIITDHKATAAAVEAAIRHKFGNYDYEYRLFDGDSKPEERQELVNWFQDKENGPKIKILGLMVKSGGVGLNLGRADKVIQLALSWNPSVDDQVESRALRAGYTGEKEIVQYKPGTYSSLHQASVRDEKRCMEAFFWEPSDDLKKSFDNWCNLIITTFYHKQLNQTKDIEDTVAKRNAASAILDGLKQQFDQALMQSLVDKLIVA